MTGYFETEKICKICGNPYQPTGRNQKYCSPCGRETLIRQNQEYEYRRRRKKGMREYGKHGKHEGGVHQKIVIRELLDELKNVPCLDCGNTFHPVAMDFDHVRGEKKFNVGKARNGGHTLAEVQTEIQKCEVVCAVCHRIRTFARRGLLKNDQF